jgi:hypothetical protein
MRAVASDVATWPTDVTDLVTAAPARSRVRPYAITGIAACVLFAAVIALWPSSRGHVDDAPSLATPAAPVPPVAPALAQPSSPPATSSPVEVAQPATTAVPATRPDGSKKTGHKKDPPHAAKPADKPLTTKPASGSADVLIVDPF